MHKDDGEEEFEESKKHEDEEEKDIEIEADTEGDGSIKNDWLMKHTKSKKLEFWMVCVAYFLSKYFLCRNLYNNL